MKSKNVFLFVGHLARQLDPPDPHHAEQLPVTSREPTALLPHASFVREKQPKIGPIQFLI